MQFTIDAKFGGEYDVIVCGGGTAGTVAAIAAGRQGARVLLLERSFTVGGMVTEGNIGITKFTEHCKDVGQYHREVLDVLATNPRSVQVAGGIAHEICKSLIDEGGATGTNGDCGGYVFTERYAVQNKMISFLEGAGVTILYDSRVCLVRKEGDTVKSVVVVNKEGFTEYAAKCVIDTTGDADVAALADVEYVIGYSNFDKDEFDAPMGLMQPMGIMYRAENIDYERLFDYLEAHPEGFELQGIAQQELKDIRESYKKGDMCCFCVQIENPDPVTAKDRPIIQVQIYISPSQNGAVLQAWGRTHNEYLGDGLSVSSLTEGHNLMLKGALEITDILRRTYPGFENTKVVHVPDIGVRETRHIVGKYRMTALDVMTGRDFEDSIGGGGHHIDAPKVPDEIRNADMNHWRFHIPYSIMVPEKVKNLLVSGRCVCATKLAHGALRVSVICMQLGEAAGVAAAMAAKAGISPSEIDVNELRRILVEGGAIL